jgi:superfamily II DNA or RNA helicase/HKD family nuclease
MPLPNGLYDLLLTEGLAPLLTSLAPGQQQLQPLSDDASDYLVDILTRQLGALLESLPGEGAEQVQHQLELVNALLVWLRQRMAGQKGATAATTAATQSVVDLIAPPARVLRAIHHQHQLPTASELGLAVPWLFTAGKGSPALLHEIRLELASSDRVDILVSFITVSGVRKLRDVLQQITAQGADSAALAGQQQPRLRILTTTYTGATEARALDELARLPGCEVRVSLDGRRTRLHAKAWMFHRATGFGSAYIGSANLSGAALTGGLEWTVKLTQRGQSALFSRAEAHFETLWADSEFQRYNPDDAAHRQALVAALGRESFGGGADGYATPIAFFDLQPKTYQQEMLEQLAAERVHGRQRNLLVAATGTGKTVVAAFDYRATCHRQGGRPRLLFVAHREEILRQALRTYREVLRDPDFGELLTGQHQPERMDHLFATIDSVAARNLVATLGAAHWHTVVVDECHRLAADRFDAFARAIRPAILLGLTATPERSDGQSILPYFDARPDGSLAVELRLWHALDLQLLAPFEYYACDDATDFSAVPWDQPAAEREAIDRLVTGNDVRARLVVNEWQRLCSNARVSKTLVFCVTVAHAEFMTACLNRAGLPAACVVGTTPPEERRRAPQRLANGDLCALVTVDLYNEGVDLPMVDTLLMLRPTQSPVLFQQQLGRGLRLSPGKESCLVLDFVGQHRADFRFDRLLSGITGLTRRELLQAVEQGFGSLPPGCHIHLQRQTREQVLQSLRTLTLQNWRRLRTELQAYAALRGRANVRLADFLHDQALELEDVYRSATGQTRSGWTALQRDAGLIAAEPGPEEDYFSRRAGSLLHLDDPARIALLEQLPALVQAGRPPDAQVAQLLQMLAYQIDSQQPQTGGPHEFLQRLARHTPATTELAALGALLQTRSTLAATPLPGLEDTPITLHAGYGIREVLTAVGWLRADRRVPFQAGTLTLPQRRCELLFVTLDKSEGYHDRIAYRDYAISTERFHWQTQHTASPDTPAGRRYLDSASNRWQFQLFVRTAKGTPYLACGPVTLLRAEGERPMSITWALQVPLPARWFRVFCVLRGGVARLAQQFVRKGSA